jgi:hypothetical protein
MHQRFLDVIDSLHDSFERLIATPPARHGQLPVFLPLRGVYLFSDNGRPLYVGRSKHLRQRVGQHCRVSSDHRQAVFAFRLAREKTGNLVAAYSTGAGSRNALVEDAVFGAAFLEAKARVRQMEFRCVEEADPTRQALLELYCAIVLDCPYNDFNTH